MSKLLLGLGTMTIAAMPVLAVVSCSDSKGPNEIGNNLFPGLSENEKNEFENSLVENKFIEGNVRNYKDFITKNKEKFLEKIYDNEIINESKTYDEVLSIATEKLNNISQKEISIFLENFMELSKYRITIEVNDNENFIIPMNGYQELNSYSKIDNIKFDNKNKLISFNISNHIGYRMKISNKEFTIIRSFSYNFENIKLKPVVYQFSSSIVNKIYIPSFIFSDVQDMCPSIKLNKNELIFDDNKIEEIIGYQYDYLKDKSGYTRDEYIQEQLKWEQYGVGYINDFYFKKYYSKNINEYFSVVDDIFNFDNKLNDYFFELFDKPLGLIDDYYYTYNDIDNDWNFDRKTGELLSGSIKPYYFSIEVPIFFSTLNEDGTANWEVYSLKQ